MYFVSVFVSVFVCVCVYTSIRIYRVCIYAVLFVIDENLDGWVCSFYLSIVKVGDAVFIISHLHARHDGVIDVSYNKNQEWARSCESSRPSE